MRRFRDASGAWRRSPETTLRAIGEAMGAGTGGPPPAGVRSVRLDRKLPDLGPGSLDLEDGASLEVEGCLPADLPAGYHSFRPRAGEPFRLIASPGRAPVPHSRAWGVSAQLYAARSRRSWGIGDLSDLATIGAWVSGLGAKFVAVNPLHAPAPGEPRQDSPYFPGSRSFHDPAYLAVREIEGAAESPVVSDLTARASELNDSTLIERDRVMKLKSEALESLFAGFGTDPDMDRYVAERGDALIAFATFSALAELHGPNWRDWPEGVRHPSSPDVRRFGTSSQGARRVRYHQWLQWQLHRQLCAARGRVPIVHDLAVGVDPQGADAWMWQDCIAEGVTVGAPPDEFNTLGQNWALPALDPWKLRVAGYVPWIEPIRAAFLHGSGLRVDHVMGLSRLFWIPEGRDPRDGAYVRYPEDDLLNVLTLEASRAGAFVVGEDLGTVDRSYRRRLSGRNVLSYRVWWFEKDPTALWPEKALGAVTTHDLPTIAGVLSGSDLEEQREEGLQPNEEASAELNRRVEATAGAGAGTGDAVARIYEDLGRAPCLLLAASLDDMLAVERRPNLPGASEHRPNWRLALPATIEQMQQAALPARVAAALAGHRGEP